MKRITGIAMVLLILMSVTIAFAGNTKDTQTDRKKVIIGFVDRPNQADENMIQGHGGKTKYTYTIINAKAVEIPEQAIEHIKKNPRVAYVEKDAEVHALGIELNNSWGVDRIDADLVHPDNKGAGVKVAIIDSGIDYTHPDLDGNYAGGIDYVNNDSDPMDDYGHGTHCAGIVAAEMNDAGVIGVAPGANLYAVKVLGATGSGYTSDVVKGIEWADKYKMDVISMSFGSSFPNEAVEEACENAYANGTLLVASAGNSGAPRGRATTTVGYPAAYDSVIAVSATDSLDVIAYFSSRGPEVEIAAPGLYINSTYLNDGYAIKSGTSMACPHVAGTAALVIASEPSLTNIEVRERLQNTADDLGTSGLDNLYGYGLVDAESAVYQPVDVHDVAVTDIVAPSWVVADLVDVDVSVKNEGTYNESFNVTLTDTTDDNEIGSELVTLIAGDSTTITFSWNTTGATLGDHILNATAEIVGGETDTADNLKSTTVEVVQEAPANTMHIASIDMSPAIIKSNGWYTYATAEVKIENAVNNSVAGVNVSGHWSGLTESGIGSGITDESGMVTFESSPVKNAAGTFTFTVTDVTLVGWTYNESANAESSDSISV